MLHITPTKSNCFIFGAYVCEKPENWAVATTTRFFFYSFLSVFSHIGMQTDAETSR